MSTEKKNTEERMIKQLAKLKYRLDTFPFANHEAVMCRDAILTIISTIVGEETNIDYQQQKPHSAKDQVIINGKVYVAQKKERKETARGKTVNGKALIDVEANMRPKTAPADVSLSQHL